MKTTSVLAEPDSFVYAGKYSSNPVPDIAIERTASLSGRVIPAVETVTLLSELSAPAVPIVKPGS